MSRDEEVEKAVAKFKAGRGGVADVAHVSQVRGNVAGAGRRKLVLINGASLLAEVHDFLGRFVAYPSPEAQIVHAAWILHTHFMDFWDSTPRLSFLSPEPESGKSRALEVTAPLVPRPVQAINTTQAYLMRKISDAGGMPTILYDEIDTVFGPKAREHEDIRAILNAGHHRGAVSGRCVVRGNNVSVEELPCFAPVALAGLGALPDTILSRSIIIRMRRRAPSENIEGFRLRIHEPQGHALRKKIEGWVVQAERTLQSTTWTWPQLPSEISDRKADMWEAIIAVADLAGGDWPVRIRVASVALVAQVRDGMASLGLRLLADLKTAFGNEPAMFTKHILEKLIDLEESPWGDLKGKPLDSRRLAEFVKPYGVVSCDVRIGPSVAKGYRRSDLHDPWLRYLSATPPLPHPPATSATPATGKRRSLIKPKPNGGLQ